MAMRKFRLIYFCKETYPAYRVDLTDLFSRRLVGKGHKLDWVMPAAEPGARGIISISTDEKVFLAGHSAIQGIVGAVLNSLNDFVNDLRGLRKIRSDRYDFVQVRDKFLTAALLLPICRLRRVPIFYWLSFPYPESDILRSKEGIHSRVQSIFLYIRGKFRSYLLYHVIIPHVDHAFVQSQRMKEDIMQHNIDGECMTPVPMGVDLERMATSKKVLERDSSLVGKKLITYVGTLVRMRKIDFLFDVLAIVLDKVPNARLLLVGGASAGDMAYLQEKAVEKKVESSVIFTGFVPMEDAWAYIRMSDVGVSPFRPLPILDSTTPTKIIEYFAFHKPAVANIHPDQSMVINDSGGGRLVEYEQVAFAQAIIELLLDPSLAKTMGERGYKYVSEKRDYAAISDELENKYLELLGW